LRNVTGAGDGVVIRRQIEQIHALSIINDLVLNRLLKNTLSGTNGFPSAARKYCRTHHRMGIPHQFPSKDKVTGS
jgi:hypothetical protein